MFTFLWKYFSPFVRQDEQLSLLQIFKPLYISVSLLGLFPCFIKFPNEKKDFTVVEGKSSTINLAYTLLITSTMCIFFGLHMLELSVASSDNQFTEDQLTLTNYIVELALALLVCITAYICALKNRNLYINILNEIIGCWASLPNGMNNITLGQLRVQVNCVVLGSLLLILIWQLAVTFTQKERVSKLILIALTFNLPNMLQFTLLAFYLVMILMIVALLKNVEKNLIILLHVRSIRGMRNDYIRVGWGPPQPSLSKLRGAYVRALGVKRQVNAAFQAPLLLILAQSFHSLVSDAHSVYHGLAFQNDFLTQDVIVCCCWVLYQLIKFHILGYSGYLLKLQANKIGRSLYNISADINEEETTLHLEIQHFAAVMRVQDTEVTIYGFFPLKSSLLYNVIASAVMYLVILVQFDGGN